MCSRVHHCPSGGKRERGIELTFDGLDVTSKRGDEVAVAGGRGGGSVAVADA